jgi:hypothetical protein
MRCGRSSRCSWTRWRSCCRTHSYRRSTSCWRNTRPRSRSRYWRGGRSRRRCCRFRNRRRRTSRCDWRARHFRRGLLRRCGLRYFFRFRCFFRRRQIAKMLAHPFRMHQVDRTRVRLFFGDASFWEVLDQDFRLDLEFSSQFINPDLIGICHSPLVSTATSYLGTAASCCC